jgi:2-polyprenyl-3-methyl-5-hydroxy-6-metoxy-1,4-benzoquinol methylase
MYEDMFDNLYAAPGVWSLTKCENSGCALLWLDPAPHPDDLGLLYRQYHTHDDVADRSPFLRFAGGLYRLISSSLLALIAVPAERKRARLMFIGEEEPATLLDVGCGDGGFLSQMSRRGWSVAGVDFDATAVARARELHGLDVEVATPESLVASGRKYAVVTVSHVIEHVPDPVEFLRQCGRLLHRGGRIILRTPNSESFGHRIYGRAWRGLEPPRHLQLFNRSSLSACAGKAGLTVLSCFTTAADAEGILILSHFLNKRSFQLHDRSKKILLEWVIVAPLLAARAKIAWLRDKNCGEELYMILTSEHS